MTKGRLAGSALPPPAPASLRGKVDRYGLPVSWSLLGDMPAEHAAREAAVVALVQDVFATAVRHLGAAEAQLLFRTVAKPQRKQPPSHNPDWNAWLLSFYDRRRAEAGPRFGPTAASREIMAMGYRPTVTEEGVRRHLNRLLQRRADVARAILRALKRQRAAVRRVYGKPLLG